MAQIEQIEWHPITEGMPPDNRHCDGNQYLVSTLTGVHQTNRNMLDFAVSTGKAVAWAYMPLGYGIEKNSG